MITHSLKVMTYNVANYDDHVYWTNRIELFAQVIVNTDPDIILLQEVRFNPDQSNTKADYQNMAEQVLAALQRNSHYSGAYHTHLPVERMPLAPDDLGYNVPSPAALSPLHRTIEWEGLSIISRLWIKEIGCLWLTPPNKIEGDRNTRATQYAAIDLTNGSGPEKLLFVFNSHFAYVVADAMQNVQESISYIKRYSTISKGYYLLAGDFNMEPGSAPINLLDQDPDFVDMWVRIWGTQSAGLTFPSNNPIKRIDYIYVSPTLSGLADTISVCGSTPDPITGVYTSDHLGLVATFKIDIPTLTPPVRNNNIVDELLNDFVIV